MIIFLFIFSCINALGESTIINRPPNVPDLKFIKNVIWQSETAFLLVSSVNVDDGLFCYRLQMKNGTDGEWHDIPVYTYLDVNESKDFMWESHQNFETDIIFNEEGTYYIKVKAVDINGIEGD